MSASIVPVSISNSEELTPGIRSLPNDPELSLNHKAKEKELNPGILSLPDDPEPQSPDEISPRTPGQSIGLKARTTSSALRALSRALSIDARTASVSSEVEPEEVRWQWLHRTGFRSYDKNASDRIECAYQDGLPFVRLKSGKFGAVPMEVFFADMVQHDPTTGNTRQVQRVGPCSTSQTAYRFGAILANNISEGRLRQIKMEEYNAHRDLAGHNPMQGQFHKSKKFEEYRADGRCAKIARHPLFTSFTYLMVIINSIYIGVDADLHQDQTLSQKDIGFQVSEHLFCLYFVSELGIRFRAMRRKKDCLQDGWFLFDTLLCLIMVAEVWIVSVMVATMDSTDGTDGGGGGAPLGGLQVFRVLRLLRLARLGRVARMLRIFPEVLTLLKGILQAMRPVFFTVLLLLLLLFVFGIIFKTQASDKPEIQLVFPTVSRSMWALLLRGTFLDSPSLYFDQFIDTAPELVFLFILFIFLSCFTVMNMLIGILCDVVRHVSELEKDKNAVADLKSSLLGLLECFDKNDDRSISKDEFDLVMRNPEMIQILRRYKVDPVDMISLRDVLFENADVTQDVQEGSAVKDLSFYEFMEVVFRLRGGNSASVMDIIDLRNYIRQRLDRFEQHEQQDDVGSLAKETLPLKSPGFRPPPSENDIHEPYTSLIKRQEAFEKQMKAWQEEQMKAWQKGQEETQQKLGFQLRKIEGFEETQQKLGFQLQKIEGMLSTLASK